MTEIQSGTGRMEGEHKRVLVVDDEAEIREVIAEFLEEQGFEVLQASNGLDALLQVKRTRPDAVILDLGMPRLGGLEALKRMHAFNAAMRIVVVTAETDARIPQQALTLGATAVLSKPVNLSDLLAPLGREALRLPTRGGASPSRVEPSEPSGVEPKPRAAPRVLVVDDDPGIRATLEEFLALKSYEVRGTADGAAAIREIVQTSPDVVLLDINLPGLNGVEALPTIRAVAPNAMVIMVSGSTDVELSKRTLAYGAFDYVTKPIDFEYLARSVETAVAMRIVD
jgi:DNA-binding response OmpR family regulator